MLRKKDKIFKEDFLEDQHSVKYCYFMLFVLYIWFIQIPVTFVQFYSVICFWWWRVVVTQQICF